MLRLNEIKAQPGAHRNNKRLGRGKASGQGQTAGKGHKGQKARSGGSIQPGFEGGQTPLYRRLPKRGFTKPNRLNTAVLNVLDLDRLAERVEEFSLTSLKEAKAVKGRYQKLTILGTGDLTKAVKVVAHKVSPSAAEKIKKAGGSVEIVEYAVGRPTGRAAESPKTETAAK